MVGAQNQTRIFHDWKGDSQVDSARWVHFRAKIVLDSKGQVEITFANIPKALSALSITTAAGIIIKTHSFFIISSLKQRNIALI